MKSILLFLAACFAVVSLSAVNSQDSLCLEISGRVVSMNKKLKMPYKVELISANRLLDSVIVNDRRDFKFMLKRDTHYAIRISKPGYATRLISVYTHVPANANVLFRFEFETELIEQDFTSRLDSDALDFPITIVSFHPELNNFYFSEEYTASLKRQMFLRKAF